MIKQEDVGKLKEGNYIMIDGCACIVTKIQRSAPGKHGHSKFRIDAFDLITGSRKVALYTGHDKVDVPIIEKKAAQVLAINGNTAQIMDLENYETFETEIPSDLQGKVMVGVQVLYWDILGKKIMKQMK